MTIVEEVLQSKKNDQLFSIDSLTKLVLSATPITTPRSLEECRYLAKHLAFSIVSGFVEHDKGHLDKAVEAFYQVYLYLFPSVGVVRARRAAELFVDACVKQDEIEDHPGHSKTQIVEDSRWNEVKSIFLEQTRILGIPDDYAEKTTNYYRYHGVRDSRYLGYCIDADRIFTTAIIGNDYWAKILGSLYVICTDCHDKHDPTGLATGIHFATKYFEIILKEKILGQQARLASLYPETF